MGMNNANEMTWTATTTDNAHPTIACDPETTHRLIRNGQAVATVRRVLIPSRNIYIPGMVEAFEVTATFWKRHEYLECATLDGAKDSAERAALRAL